MSDEVERPIVRLKVVNRDLTIDCPYVHRPVSAVVCFTGQRAATHPYCFRCPDGAVFESKLQTRTFKRVVVPSEMPDAVIWIRVKVNSKKTGVKYTYAKYKEGEITLPYNEMKHDYRLDTAKLNGWRTYSSPYQLEHHDVLSEEHLNQLAESAAHERKNMRRGMAPTSESGGKKKMVGAEMKSLIEDRKRRDAMPEQKSTGNWFLDMRAKRLAGETAKSQMRETFLKVKSRPVKEEKRVALSGFKKKTAMPETASSLIKKEAQRLTMKRKG